MDRRVVMLRLKNQLEQQVALAELADSTVIFNTLKGCFQEAGRLAESVHPSVDDLKALALRLRATALQPGPLSGQATLRIAASYHWLARQLEREGLVSP
jgi:phosphate uptake regulator